MGEKRKFRVRARTFPWESLIFSTGEYAEMVEGNPDLVLFFEHEGNREVVIMSIEHYAMLLNMIVEKRRKNEQEAKDN